MSRTVYLVADTLTYPGGGGHRWAYLNWALGLRAAGCEVVWVEAVEPDAEEEEVSLAEAALRADLEPHRLAQSIAVYDQRESADPLGALEAPRGEIDLLLTIGHGAPQGLLQVARHSALIDIDPGLTQLWIREGHIRVPRHDAYFTIGEAARAGGSGLPECGIDWRYTPPCVSLSDWPVVEADGGAPYTTVTHWWEKESYVEFDGQWTENTKRAGFEPFIELPARTGVSLELAIGGLDSPEEEGRLRGQGWSVRDTASVAATTSAYASYLRSSRGEFSCVKPSAVRLAPGWVSDRSLCYLASGKPVIVQDTGELELPDPERGMLRFRTPDQAIEALERVEREYELHCQAARALAEARFDSRAVATSLLEQALP